MLGLLVNVHLTCEMLQQSVEKKKEVFERQKSPMRFVSEKRHGERGREKKKKE